MITDYRNIQPYITFGFDKKEALAGLGEPITVWLGTIYNPEYSTNIIYDSVKGSMTKVSDFQYVISFSEAGTYEIYIAVTDKDKTFTLQSNTITLTIE